MNSLLYHQLTRTYPKELFIGCTYTGNSGMYKGFCINQCTVLFNFLDSKMEVTFFEKSGKSKTDTYPFPKDKEQLVVFIKETCPKEIINKQIKYFS